MKKSILVVTIILILLIPSFAGCSSEPAPTSGTDQPVGTTSQSGGTMLAGTGNADAPNDLANDEDSPNNAANDADISSESPNEPEQLYPTPDYSDFEFPEETNSLTVYAYTSVSSVMSPAVEIFKQKYPNVQVDYQILGEDEYNTRIRAEIPAGRGPDVMIADASVLPDVYKTMSTRIFADLGGFMEEDEEYNPSDYNEGVMKGGLLYGCQYIIPLAYSSSCIITSEELLAEIGLTPDSLGTWQGFCEACRLFHENHPGAALFSHEGNRYYLTTLYPHIGFRMIDYEKNAVFFNEERFRDMIDLCRLYCYPNIPKEPLWGAEYQAVHDRTCFFINENKTILTTITNRCLYWRDDYDETPLMIAIPDEHDGVSARIEYYGAVPEASKNKLNAWRMMKILLSHEVQYGEEREDKWTKPPFMAGLPIRMESLRKALDSNTYWYGANEADVEQYYHLMESVTDSVLMPTIIQNYITQSMSPYITSKDGSNYDKQFEKLRSTLELYKDE